MTSPINKFNIRVYGVLINAHQEVLLVKEKIGHFEFVKFPGGGLHFGEGTADCILREFKEETDQDISIVKHIYTTDFFVQSAFKTSDQLLSIYYQVACDTFELIPSQRTIQIEGSREEMLTFNWVKLNELNTDMLTFPIDKYLVSNYLTNRLPFIF
jgi:ADP-ribose pyrophosphatase YjhB (NUDIX family)